MTALPYADGSFDTVLCFLMLHHVIEWERALLEIRRVLRPGGALAGYDFLDHAVPKLIHRLDGSPHKLFSASALVDGLDDAGFLHSLILCSAGGVWARFRAVAPER